MVDGATVIAIDGAGQESETPDPQQIRQAVEAVVGRLEKLGEQHAAKRSTVEERWRQDQRQYDGEYEPAQASRLRESGRSQVYVGLTRAKAHAWESKLSDLLFPSDEKNWGLKPTPVPELAETAKRADDEAERLTETANRSESRGDVAGANAAAQQAQAQADAAKQAKAERDEAQRRAEQMERLIDDQLREANYAAQCRQAIHDGVVRGTGVMKGPLAQGRGRRRFRQQEDGSFSLTEEEDPRPQYSRVDPWAFVPDADARTLDEAEFTFERHLMTPSELKRLAKRGGFDKDAIRDLLQEGAKAGAAHDPRTEGGEAKEKFTVWEYHGPLDTEDLKAIGQAVGGDELAGLTPDPLSDVQVIVWFSQGRLLRFAPHPLDSGDKLYSAWSFEPDDTSIFGYGVPYLMRDTQRVVNSAWRAMMDNGALAAGPQVVVDKGVEPADGDWALRGLKIWQRSSQADPNVNPFQVFNIPPNQQYYANIIDLAVRFADVETSLPEVAQGGGADSAGVARTAQGTAILMNAANAVFRRVIRAWDDDMTVPNIERAYQFNMQFSPREDIKGDQQVDARGSSVLLVQELQAQNLMAMLGTFAGHPQIAPWLKIGPAVRKLVQAHHLSADDLVATREEVEVQQEQQQEQPDPERLKIEADRETAQLKAEVDREKLQADLERARIEQETALSKLAQESNLTLEQLEARIAEARMKAEAQMEKTEAETRSKERLFAAEAAAQNRRPNASGGGGFL